MSDSGAAGLLLQLSQGAPARVLATAAPAVTSSTSSSSAADAIGVLASLASSSPSLTPVLSGNNGAAAAAAAVAAASSAPSESRSSGNNGKSSRNLAVITNDNGVDDDDDDDDAVGSHYGGGSEGDDHTGSSGIPSSGSGSVREPPAVAAAAAAAARPADPPADDAAAYAEMCSIVNMDGDTRREAWALWQSVARDGAEADARPTMAACMYICSLVLSSDQLSVVSYNRITISQLLRAAETTLVVFFERLEHVLRAHESSSTNARSGGSHTLVVAVRNRVTLLQRKFCVLTALWAKLRQAIVLLYDCSLPNLSEPAFSTHRQILDFTWVLFLVLKHRALGDRIASLDQLVTAYELLLCVLSFVTTHSSAKLLRQAYQYMSACDRSSIEKTTRQQANLEVLSTLLNLPLDEVRHLFTTKWLTFEKVQREAGTLKFSKSHVPITEPIHRAYADIYMETCDFDERLWLSNDPQVQTPAPSRGNIMDLVRRPTPRRSGLTPVSKQNVVAFTPVKRVLDNVQSLKDILQSSQSAPSLDLQAIFSQCEPNPTGLVMNLLQRMKGSFVTQYAAKVGDQHAEISDSRFEMSARLFFRILEATLRSEQERLKSSTAISQMLSNEYFHRSLLACCIEIVLFTYRIEWETPLMGEHHNSSQDGTVAFPWALSVCETPAYEFFKIVETVVRSEPMLATPQHIRHIKQCEEVVLCCLAWQADSPLWELLEKFGRFPISHDDRARQGSADAPQLEDNSVVKLCLSPVKPRISRASSAPSVLSLASGRKRSRLSDVPEQQQQAEKAAEAIVLRTPSAESISINVTTAVDGDGNDHDNAGDASAPALAPVPAGTAATLAPSAATQSVSSPSSPAKGGAAQHQNQNNNQTQRSRSLDYFFRKFLFTAHQHLQRMAQRLALAERETQRVWACVQHFAALENHLMQSRHLDVLILCSIYAVCKLGEHERQFKSIVQMYEALSGSDRQTCRKVALDAHGTECGTIIEFYNKIFIPCMREFVSESARPDFKPERLGLDFQAVGAAAEPRQQPRQHLPGSQLYLSPLRHPRVAGLGSKSASTPSIQMTPRTKALYFEESPSRSRESIEAINNAINNATAQGFGARHLRFGDPGVLGDQAAASAASAASAAAAAAASAAASSLQRRINDHM